MPWRMGGRSTAAPPTASVALLHAGGGEGEERAAAGGVGGGGSELVKPLWALASLRAKMGDPVAGAELLSSYLAWRQRWSIGDESSQPASNPRLQALLRSNILDFCGNRRDKYGRYIVIFHCRFYDPVEFSAKEYAFAFHSCLMTMLAEHPEAQTYGIVVLEYCADISVKLLASKQDVEDIKMCRDLVLCLPVRIEGYWFVSVPWWYKKALELIKKFYHPSVRKKFVIGLSLERLLEEVDSDQLPVEMDGTAEAYDHTVWVDRHLLEMC